MARNAIEAARGERIDDSELIEELCRGYGSAQFLHVHHIMWRSRGGGHETENLTTVCGGHHGALHRGEIVITGKAPAIVVTRTFQAPTWGKTNQRISRQARVKMPCSHSRPHEEQVAACSRSGAW